MNIKKFDQLLETELNEDKKVITNVVKGFPSISSNYRDSHRKIDPFGALWGRGVLFKDNKGYFALVDSYGTSHSNIRKRRPNKEAEKTFYFGYDQRNKTLYIADGSIGGELNKPGLQAIFNAITNMGPLKGSVLRH